MHRHPRHYTGENRSLDGPVTVEGRYNPYVIDDENSYIICSCGSGLFTIFVSSFPEVKCQCANCGKTHLVYDVTYYPAAGGYAPERGKFTKWISPDGTDCFQVIAVWMYPEERDVDEEDDDDDIDWFVLVARKPGTDEYFEVVNDETA